MFGQEVLKLKCILYDRDCIECGECRCDLDPDKICDNCMECLHSDADYSGVLISGIQLNQESEASGEHDDGIL